MATQIEDKIKEINNKTILIEEREYLIKHLNDDKWETRTTFQLNNPTIAREIFTSITQRVKARISEIEKLILY